GHQARRCAVALLRAVGSVRIWSALVGHRLGIVMQENELNKLRESLVGATLRECRVEQGEQSLAILADRGVVVLITDADCCSETWFADLLGVSNVLGKE